MAAASAFAQGTSLVFMTDAGWELTRKTSAAQ